MSSHGVSLAYRSFQLPKRGNSEAEYEDACDQDEDRGRFAIADGASESSFAGRWAQLLVKSFVDCSGPGSWWDALPALQKQWDAEFSGREMAWYAETKVQQGAFATFLGLEVVERRSWWWWRKRQWRAVAVGDACLFQVRKNRLYRTFPLKHSADFNNSPWLVGSHDACAEALKKEARCQGDCRTEDRLWLMTDALAQWFLERHEDGQKPWEVLEPLLVTPTPPEDFAVLVDGLRDCRQLRNDDVTLAAVYFE